MHRTFLSPADGLPLSQRSLADELGSALEIRARVLQTQLHTAHAAAGERDWTIITKTEAALEEIAHWVAWLERHGTNKPVV